MQEELTTRCDASERLTVGQDAAWSGRLQIATPSKGMTTADSIRFPPGCFQCTPSDSPSLPPSSLCLSPLTAVVPRHLTTIQSTTGMSARSTTTTSQTTRTNWILQKYSRSRPPSVSTSSSKSKQGRGGGTSATGAGGEDEKLEWDH